MNGRWTVIGTATLLLGLVALGSMISVTVLSVREVDAPEALLGLGSAAVGALATLLATQGKTGDRGDEGDKGDQGDASKLMALSDDSEKT